jgi:hypothetical protein
MNATSVRPETKFAAALVAAGVVSAASIVGVPENRGLPVINIDVANASVITDALYGLGDAVNGVAAGAAWTFDGAFSLPFDGLSAAVIATQYPSLSPNLLSWLVQRYANPSDLYPYWSYPWAIKVDSIEPLAGLLPSPIGSSIIDAVNQIANAINDGLSGLPDPTAGEFATGQFWSTDIGRTVVAANYAFTAPVWMLYETAYYLGYLPADLEATVESAIQDPSEIPGLLSNLVYGLLSPSSGLLGGLLYYATLPLTTLPGPIGELSTNFVIAISDGIDGLLSLLPAPISPTPFPSAIQSTQFSDTSVEPNSLPEASLAVAGAITVPSTEAVEKKVEATDSTVAGVQDQDPAPAADADGLDAGADTVVTNKVKSGNKVSPGDKFGSQAKTETVADDGAAVPGADEVAVDEPAADPVKTETEGADPAPAADADAAA